MTNLERVIQEATARSVVTTVSRTTDAIADELTRELLKDPILKAAMQRFIREAFQRTLTTLNEEAPPDSPA